MEMKCENRGAWFAASAMSTYPLYYVDLSRLPIADRRFNRWHGSIGTGAEGRAVRCTALQRGEADRRVGWGGETLEGHSGNADPCHGQATRWVGKELHFLFFLQVLPVTSNVPPRPKYCIM